MIKLAKEDETYAEMFSLILENGLQSIADDDGFGSELQCDPRGDGRNGEFSMDILEGID